MCQLKAPIAGNSRAITKIGNAELVHFNKQMLIHELIRSSLSKNSYMRMSLLYIYKAAIWQAGNGDSTPGEGISLALAQLDNPPSRAYLNRQVAVLISFDSEGFNRIVENPAILALDSTGIVDKIPRLRVVFGPLSCDSTGNRNSSGRDTRGIV
jgi:hypothetical protein